MAKVRQGVSNILQHLENRTEKYANNIALGIKTHFGWKEFTYRGIGLMSRKIASYFIDDIQLKKGEREVGEYPYYGANGIQDYVSDYIFNHFFSQL